MKHTTHETENLLLAQLGQAHFLCSSSLFVVLISFVIVPLMFNDDSALAKSLNYGTAFGNTILLIFCYNHANKVKEYAGKTSFLKKQRNEKFAQEQLMQQQQELMLIEQQYQASQIPQYYQPQIPQDIPAYPTTYTHTQDDSNALVPIDHSTHTLDHIEPQSQILANPECPFCGCSSTSKHQKNKNGTYRYKCVECNKTFGEQINE